MFNNRLLPATLNEAWSQDFATNPTPRQRDLRRRFQAFHGKAGGVVGRAASTALSLANAERALERAVYLGRAEVVWEYDQDPDNSWMEGEDLRKHEAGLLEVLTCVLKIDGKVCAALGSISVLNDTAENRQHARDYKRQVEAELASECLDKLQQVTRYKVRGAR